MKQNKKKLPVNLLLALLISTGLFLMMEIANRNGQILQMGILPILGNIGIIFSVIAVIRILTGRWSLGCGIVSLVLTILGVVNLYSIEFRQVPISTKDLHNARTALNVLGAYEIHIRKRVILIFIMGAIFLLLAVYLWQREKKREKRTKKRILVEYIGGAVVITLFYAGMLGGNSAMAAGGVGWTWEPAYYGGGFVATSLTVAKQSMIKVAKPEGYSEELVAECENTLQERQGTETPDIFLILNESWYDFSLVSDYETSEELHPFLDSLTNCIRGHAVVPGLGGGTNLAEYEYLTGNSLQLVQGVTPFNSLHMDEEATVVSVLSQQGYRTAAFHPAPGLNYNRSVAYPAMGFDDIYFEDDVTGLEYWQQRTEFATDASDFKVLREIYEKNLAESDEPQFFYNLTIQNHGGYGQVSADKVPVSVTGGNKNLDEWSGYELNEYFSCIKMTDEAFQELIAYFEQSDRPVIVCMVGDHSPNIAEKLVTKDLTEEERMLYLHSTPYVIWSNRELAAEEEPEFIGMSSLMPEVLKLAGVSMPAYYRYVTEELTPQVPMVTSMNVYLDRDRNEYAYTDATPYTELVTKYLSMEYWNVTGHKDSSLFTLNQK